MKFLVPKVINTPKPMVEVFLLAKTMRDPQMTNPNNKRRSSLYCNIFSRVLKVGPKTIKNAVQSKEKADTTLAIPKMKNLERKIMSRRATRNHSSPISEY
jgi:hypothetical protein